MHFEHNNVEHGVCTSHGRTHSATIARASRYRSPSQGRVSGIVRVHPPPPPSPPSSMRVTLSQVGVINIVSPMCVKFPHFANRNPAVHNNLYFVALDNRCNSNSEMDACDHCSVLRWYGRLLMLAWCLTFTSSFVFTDVTRSTLRWP